MELGKILSPDAIRVVSVQSSKKRLFHMLGEMADSVYGLDTKTVVNALLERETLGPTGVGHGVALPHARLAGLSQVVGLFVLLEKPIEFDAVDNVPVDLVFTLLAPENAGVEHLRALALVSRTLREPNVCAKLRANADPATLFAILAESQNVQAA